MGITTTVNFFTTSPTQEYHSKIVVFVNMVLLGANLLYHTRQIHLFWVIQDEELGRVIHCRSDG